MSNKLSPINVYVPVSVKKELPDGNMDGYFCFNKYGDKYVTYFRGSKSGKSVLVNNNECIWLKEQESYVFSKEELEGLLKDAFEMFQYRPFPHNEPTFEQYIQSLFQK